MLSIRTPIKSHFLATVPRRHRTTTPFLRRTITMSFTTSSQIIEHVVLFKAKPTATTSSLTTMLTNLNSLITLPQVLHISAAPIHRCHSTTSPFTFTHILHSRHRTKPDLTSYAEDPTHVGVVVDNVRPNVDDVMAVDWVADGFVGSPVVRGGERVKLVVVKMKEGVGENGKCEVVKRIKERFRGGSVTVGENFSLGRAKGYTICSIAVTNGAEIDGLDLEMSNEFVEDVLVVDFVVPVTGVRSTASSL